MEKLLLTNEVAEMLRVSEHYVRELLRERKLEGYKESRRSGYRIPYSAVTQYIEMKIKEHKKSEVKP